MLQGATASNEDAVIVANALCCYNGRPMPLARVPAVVAD
jgi:hypothetical protein